jgi:tetratricopeptide (TPR) repeat protein
MRFRLGRYDDATKDIEVALERARKVGAKLAQLELLLDQGILYDWLDQWQRSAVITEEAVAMAKDEALPPAVEARLLMARGRTFQRAGNLAPAVALFQQTLAVAEPLGDDGYEALSQSLNMLTFAFSNLGTFDEAMAASERQIAVAEEHNDSLMLGQALLQRGLLSFMLGKAEALVMDYRRCIQITRELGFAMLEGIATKDLGEVLFYLGRPDDAEPLAQRAAEVYSATHGEKSPRVTYAEVLLARVKAYRGDVEGARETLERITRKQAELQAEGKPDSALPADGKAQLDGVELWLNSAPDAEFDALIAHARAVNLQAPDIIEIMEWKALSALRVGRRADGVRMLEDAYAEAEKTAKIVTDRLRRRIDQAQTGALAAS